MENTIINNIKPKKPCTEAQKRAEKAFYQRNKDNKEYKQKQRANSKRCYENDKERIIERVRTNQRRFKELEQLKKLNEVKEQGFIIFKKMSLMIIMNYLIIWRFWEPKIL